MRGLRVLLALLTLICVAAGTNAEITIPPSPAQWATDTAGFLKPQTVADLDARLRAYQSETGHQVLVYIAPTTGAAPTEDWTVRAFARWKVGRKGLDDGLILFVFPTDRKVRIEVGYGLEQSVPDATAARIIRDTITPKIRAGQPDEAVSAGVDQILGAIGGVAPRNGDVASGKASRDVSVPRTFPSPVWATPPEPRSGEVFGEAIGVIIGILVAIGVVWFIIWLVAKLPDPPAGTYVSSHDSGWGCGLAGMILSGVADGIGSGGGFSGGGGMSGGGGATGSW